MSALFFLAAMMTTQPKPKQVVFVCEHGTVKSVVAIEYFNRLAREKGLNVHAISRGTNPDSVVPGPVAAGLKQDGFDVSAFHARLFTKDDLANAVMGGSSTASWRSASSGARTGASRAVAAANTR